VDKHIRGARRFKAGLKLARKLGSRAVLGCAYLDEAAQVFQEWRPHQMQKGSRDIRSSA